MMSASPSVAAAAPSVSSEHDQTPLLFARVVFALLWAALLAVTAPVVGVAGAIVLALYPLGDVVLVAVDARSASRVSRAGLVANAGLSLVAAVALVVAATVDVPSVLLVWAVWAVVAGLGQLVVALSRRRVRRGQWPLVVSGALSVVVGGAFAVMATGPAPSLLPLAGYAVAGAVFALVGALRLRGARSGT